MIYHLAKDAVLRRANTNPNNLGQAKPLPTIQCVPQAPTTGKEQEPELSRQASDLFAQ